MFPIDLCSIELSDSIQIRQDLLMRIPSEDQFIQWHESLCNYLDKEIFIGIRIVDNEESQALNQQYRGKDAPTNILSFPMNFSLEGSDFISGDLVFCVPVIFQEIESYKKELTSHWLHLFCHGVLHILGYDHIEDKEAKEMEALEIEFLSKQGIANPYIMI